MQPNKKLNKKLKEFINDYYYDNAALQSEVDCDWLEKNAQDVYEEWKMQHQGNGYDEWTAAEIAYNNIRKAQGLNTL